ncbi:ribosome maturation factor RimM [Sphaerotilus microaerophilus]|uniref:Ribosome maturation factor RimM n=1 Tax=Sphaerotilus microaerophilus TaxID=2914710 RepID=A0ABN6PX72_9BURK|nr:ribosome maturation factor RimM [Sphaerotilus sp. FB-5]BDI07766.1 ribosome maturation factor RimM [Sphaerotilus sp. FB-5]
MTTHDDDLPWPDDAVEVARIADAWGVKGWVRVEPYARDPKALLSSRRWFLQPPAGRSRPAGAPTLPGVLRITLVKEHGDGVIASAQEIPDRNTAEALRGARVFVSRASFPTAAQDEYYWVDLIGLEVVNRAGVLLGTVADLLDTGAHSVLRVQLPEGERAATSSSPEPEAAPETPPDEAAPAAPARRSRRKVPEAEPAERLIPFVAAYIDEVKLAERRILVDWEADY